MVFDLAGAAMALAAVLTFWLIPLPVFLLTTRMRGFEKFNWALLIAGLSWPGFAVYLFYSGGRRRGC